MWTESEPMTRDFYNKNLGNFYRGYYGPSHVAGTLACTRWCP